MTLFKYRHRGNTLFYSRGCELLHYTYISLFLFFVAVYRLLNKLGGYLSPRSSVPGDVTPLVAALLKMNGAPLFDFYIDTDLQDSKKSAVFLDLPTGYQVNSFFYQNLVSMVK